MRWLFVTLLAGCFDPKPPVFGDPDAPLAPDVAVDPFAHIQLAPGYGVSVFHDFSPPFVFDANDWPEETETHDNQPRYVLALDAPFPRALGVLAGREILVLDGTTVEAHDFGNHPRNTAGQADQLLGATIVPMFDNGTETMLVVASGSEDTGDGLFAIDASWAIATDLSINNTRCVVYDATGAFDGLNVPHRYFGHQGGFIRRTGEVQVTGGDVASAVLVGDTFYITRETTSGEELVEVSSLPRSTDVLATRTTLRLSAGAPAGAIAWAIADESQLALVRADGTLDVVAELTDTAYLWTSAVAPPSGHPQAGRVYVLESHRGQGIDRLLAISLP